MVLRGDERSGMGATWGLKGDLRGRGYIYVYIYIYSGFTSLYSRN